MASTRVFAQPLSGRHDATPPHKVTKGASVQHEALDDMEDGKTVTAQSTTTLALTTPQPPADSVAPPLCLERQTRSDELKLPQRRSLEVAFEACALPVWVPQPGEDVEVILKTTAGLEGTTWTATVIEGDARDEHVVVRYHELLDDDDETCLEEEIPLAHLRPLLPKTLALSDLPRVPCRVEARWRGKHGTGDDCWWPATASVVREDWVRLQYDDQDDTKRVVRADVRPLFVFHPQPETRDGKQGSAWTLAPPLPSYPTVKLTATGPKKEKRAPSPLRRAPPSRCGEAAPSREDGKRMRTATDAGSTNCCCVCGGIASEHVRRIGSKSSGGKRSITAHFKCFFFAEAAPGTDKNTPMTCEWFSGRENTNGDMALSYGKSINADAADTLFRWMLLAQSSFHQRVALRKMPPYHGCPGYDRSCLWRHSDRHTIFISRALVAIVPATAAGQPALPASAQEEATRTRPVLSAAVAYRVAFGAIAFRMVNRLTTFVRFHFAKRALGTRASNATVAEWKQALCSMEEGSDAAHAVGRAERRFAASKCGDSSTPVPAATAVTPEDAHLLLRCIMAMKELGIAAFTGQHQSNNLTNVTEALRFVASSQGEAWVASLRNIEDGSSACTQLMELQGVQNFFAWQIYCDLRDPRHNIFVGDAHGIHSDFVILGPGAIRGAGLLAGLTLQQVDEAPPKGFNGDQSEAVAIARQLVQCGRSDGVGWRRLGLTQPWCEAMWRPDARYAGIELNIETVEHALCEFYKVVYNTVKDGRVCSPMGVAGASQWVPNPVTTAEFRCLYPHYASSP